MVEGDFSWFINCLVDMFVWERFGLFSCVLWDASATVCVWISRNGFRKVMDDNSLFHFKELQHNLAAAESVQREIEVMIQGSAGPLLSSSSSRSCCIDFWKIRYTLPFLKKLRCFWSLPPYHYTVICGWLDKCLHKSRETNSHLKNKPAGRWEEPTPLPSWSNSTYIQASREHERTGGKLHSNISSSHFLVQVSISGPNDFKPFLLPKDA